LANIKVERSLSVDADGANTEQTYSELNLVFRKEYADVFADKLPSKPTKPRPGAPLHRIRLIDENKRMDGRLMRTPVRHYAMLKNFLDAEVAAGRLRLSASLIASGMFLVPKKDPNIMPRVVHDYRALNENTIKDQTPITHQDETLEAMARAKVRGKMDCVSSYSQIGMDPRDIHKTAFKTPWGLYEWTVMPQGLCNAPATFQRWICYILQEYIGRFCSAYLDDISIYSDSIEDHKKHIHLVLQALRDHGVLVSTNKSVLFADRIEFLGHFISSKGIEADPSKLEKITLWPTPKSASEIKGFLGLVNYLVMLDFVPGLANYSSVLTDLTKKGVQFIWTKNHEAAFNTIKRLCRSVQFLQRLDYESGEPIWLITDASSKGVGGYVAQGPDWQKAKPIGFFSRQYRSAEVNYPTHEQEMLAVVECMKHWHPQLSGTQFEVLTDHAPLQFWKTQRDLSKRQIR
jgi:hypothetical protein